MKFEDIEARWNNSCRSREEKRLYWEQLAFGGWFDACRCAVQDRDRQTLQSWLGGSTAGTQKKIVEFEENPIAQTFGGLTRGEMVRTYFRSALTALDTQATSSESAANTTWISGALPPAFLQDLRDQLAAKSPVAEGSPVSILFPLARSGDGTLAKFTLERLPHGHGEIFLDPRDAFIPLGPEFQRVFTDAPLAIAKIMEGKLAKWNVRVSVTTFDDREKPRLLNLGLEGASVGGAMALGLWSLATGEPLDEGLVASFRLRDSASTTSQPDGKCYDVGGEFSKLVAVAKKLASVRRSPPIFLVAEKQGKEVDGTARRLGLVVKRAGTVEQAFAIGAERSRQALAYLGALERAYGSIQFPQWVVDVSKDYIRVCGAKQPVAANAPGGRHAPIRGPTDEGQVQRDYDEGKTVDWEKIRSARVREERFPSPWVVLGNGGAGKTTWLHHEVLNVIQNAKERIGAGSDLSSIPLPIAFDAKGFEPPFAENPCRYLQERVASYLGDDGSLRPDGDVSAIHKVVEEAWNAGSIVLFFDAFEEASAGAREKVLVASTAAIRNQCQVFVTCRTAAQRQTFPSELQFHLAPFTEEHIQDFTTRWFVGNPAQAGKLLRALSKNSWMAEYSHNPLMLAIICTVYKTSGHLPKTRVALMESCLQRFLGAAGREQSASLRACWMPVLEAMALMRLENKRPLDSKDIESVRTTTPCTATWSAKEFFNLIDELVDHSGILKRLPGGLEIYYDFSLASFGEYLAARHLATQDAWEGRLQPHLCDVDWCTIYPLLAGELAVRRGKNAVETLVARLVKCANDIRQGKGEFVRGLDTLMAQAIVDCIKECPDALKAVDQEQLWGVVLWAIDRSQVRLREDQWKRLAEPGLVRGALGAIRSMVGESIVDLALKAAAFPGIGEALPQLLDSSCPIVRWVAVWVAGRDEVTSGYDFIEKLLANPSENSQVRAAAARALARINGGQAASCVRRAFDDPCEEVARGAAIALGWIPTSESLEALLSKAESGPPLPVLSSIVGSIDAFVRNKDKQRPELTPDQKRRTALIAENALAQKAPFSENLRGAAMSTLGNLEFLPAFEPLKAIASSDDEDPGVRSSAAYGLEQLIPLLPESDRCWLKGFFVEQLNNRTGDTVRMRTVAASALGKFEDSNVLPLLLLLLRKVQEGDDENVIGCAFYSIMRLDAERDQVVKVLASLPRKRLSTFRERVSQHPSTVGVELCLGLLDARGQRPDAPEIGKDVLFTLSRLAYFVRGKPPLRDQAQKCLTPDAVQAFARWCLDHLGYSVKPLRCAAFGVLEAFAESRLRGFIDNEDYLARSVKQCMLPLESASCGVGERKSALVLLQALAKLPTAQKCLTPDAVQAFARWCLDHLEYSGKSLRCAALGVLEAFAGSRLRGFIDNKDYLARSVKQCMLPMESASCGVGERESALVLLQALVKLPKNPFTDNQLRSTMQFCLEWQNDSVSEYLRKTARYTLNLLSCLLGNRVGNVRRDARDTTSRLRGEAAKVLEKKEKTTNVIRKGWDPAAYHRPEGAVLGIVRRVIRSRSSEDTRKFGFIQAQDGQEFYLDPHSLENLRWEEVTEGMVVTFMVGQKPVAGMKARVIRVRTAQRTGDS